MNREREMIFFALLTLLISTRSFGYSLIDPGGFALFHEGFSWPNVDITFDIDPTFTTAYGVNGEAAFNNALATWDTIFSTQATGASTQTGSPLHDLESIALHELGHAIGLSHPDEADDLNRNFIDAVGTIGNASGAEMMNSTIQDGEVQRELTDDDLLGFNHLYNFDLNFTAGADAEIGETFGSDIDIFAFSFSDTPSLPDYGSLALASVLFDGATGPGRIIGIDIFFNTDAAIGIVPLPGAFWLLGSALGLLGLAVRRKAA